MTLGSERPTATFISKGVLHPFPHAQGWNSASVLLGEARYLRRWSFPRRRESTRATARWKESPSPLATTGRLALRYRSPWGSGALGTMQGRKEALDSRIRGNDGECKSMSDHRFQGPLRTSDWKDSGRTLETQYPINLPGDEYLDPGHARHPFFS